jgi:V/A-type H+-transporting ATPase subunit I
VISEWVPEESAERMKRALTELGDDHVLVEIERPEELLEVSSGALKVPILHRNPLLLRPFEKLVRLYGTPSYEEVEPTAFFAISFLLMFGLMFGDVGHGLVLALAGYLLFRYVPRYLDYGILLMEGGVSAAAFGVLYGSLFGIEGVLPVLWLSPLADLSRFLLFALALGVTLISVGLALNVINTWRTGQRARALFGAHGLLGAFGYWVLAALAARAFIGKTWNLPTAVVVAVAAVPVLLLAFKRPLVARLERGRPIRPSVAGTPRVLAALEGSVELVDTAIGFFTNTLSFLRVAAFAMVHAGAFLALFALADTIARTGAGTPGSLAVLVAGNVGMIFLEGLTVSVQVLRLEYYEFFGKFFRGGGEPYRPLMFARSEKVRSS